MNGGRSGAAPGRVVGRARAARPLALPDPPRRADLDRASMCRARSRLRASGARPRVRVSAPIALADAVGLGRQRVAAGVERVGRGVVDDVEREERGPQLPGALSIRGTKTPLLPGTVGFTVMPSARLASDRASGRKQAAVSPSSCACTCCRQPNPGMHAGRRGMARARRLGRWARDAVPRSVGEHILDVCGAAPTAAGSAGS